MGSFGLHLAKFIHLPPFLPSLPPRLLSSLPSSLPSTLIKILLHYVPRTVLVTGDTIVSKKLPSGTCSLQPFILSCLAPLLRPFLYLDDLPCISLPKSNPILKADLKSESHACWGALPDHPPIVIAGVIQHLPSEQVT